MAGRCSVCRHSEVGAINGALIEGVPLRTIADQWSVSKTALIRHKDGHLPAHLVKAAEVEEVARADDLLPRVQEQQDRIEALFGAAVSILKDARDEKDHVRALEAIRTALQSQREARGAIELLARLLGELQEGVTVNVAAISVSPAWVEIRAAILRALMDYPEAREAVAAELRRLHAGS